MTLCHLKLFDRETSSVCYEFSLILMHQGTSIIPYLLQLSKCYKKKVVSLIDGEFLEDSIINMCLLNDPRYFHPNVTIVAGGTTQLLRMEEELIPMMMEKKNAGLTCFVLNDNSSVEVGGSHWSLLVLNNKTKVFHHFDSSQQFNSKVAFSLAKNVAAAFDWSQTPLQAPKCQQQTSNGNDCGVHALRFCKALCSASSNSNYHDGGASIR